MQDTDFSHVQKSNLYQIKVPSYYWHRTYDKLFDNLTTRRYMIPLGLYRTGTVNLNDYKPQDNIQGMVLRKNIEEEGNWKTFNYVVTNPDRDTKLAETDRVFVLAKQDPGDPEHWDDYNGQN